MRSTEPEMQSRVIEPQKVFLSEGAQDALHDVKEPKTMFVCKIRTTTGSRPKTPPSEPAPTEEPTEDRENGCVNSVSAVSANHKC